MSTVSTTCEQKYATHTFDIALATALGSPDLAIFLHHIFYWIEYNTRMKKNLREGRYWSYQTFEELKGHFPYWSIKQLRLIVQKLVKSGILIKGNFNNNKYDHTLWYSVDYEKVKSICPKGQIETPERADRTDQMEDSSNTDNKTDNKTKERESAPSRKLFGSHVLLSSEEYDSLCEKFTKAKMDLIIDDLNDYCLAHDYKYSPNGYAAAIRNWIKKEKIFSPTQKQNSQGGNEKENYDWCKFLINEYHSPTTTLTLLGKYLEFTPNGMGQPICLEYSANGFKEQFESNLRKCGFRKRKLI